jgi:hypothetical protein
MEAEGVESDVELSSARVDPERSFFDRFFFLDFGFCSWMSDSLAFPNATTRGDAYSVGSASGWR